MKKIYSIFMAAALLVAGVAMTGCQKDNNDPEQKAEAKTYKMSIKASMGAADTFAKRSRAAVCAALGSFVDGLHNFPV